MPQSKSRKIAILGYRSVGEWLPRLCRGLSPRTRPGHVAGRRAGGARFITSILSGGGGAFPCPRARRTGGGGRRPRGGRGQPSRVSASVPPSLSTLFSHQFNSSPAFQQRKPLLASFPSVEKLNLLKKAGKLPRCLTIKGKFPP